MPVAEKIKIVPFAELSEAIKARFSFAFNSEPNQESKDRRIQEIIDDIKENKGIQVAEDFTTIENLITNSTRKPNVTIANLPEKEIEKSTSTSQTIEHGEHAHISKHEQFTPSRITPEVKENNTFKNILAEIANQPHNTREYFIKEYQDKTSKILEPDNPEHREIINGILMERVRILNERAYQSFSKDNPKEAADIWERAKKDVSAGSWKEDPIGIQYYNRAKFLAKQEIQALEKKVHARLTKKQKRILYQDAVKIEEAQNE